MHVSGWPWVAIKETGPVGRKTRKEVWFKDGLVEKPDHETWLTLKTRLKQKRTDFGLVAPHKSLVCTEQKMLRTRTILFHFENVFFVIFVTRI